MSGPSNGVGIMVMPMATGREKNRLEQLKKRTLSLAPYKTVLCASCCFHYDLEVLIPLWMECFIGRVTVYNYIYPAGLFCPIRCAAGGDPRAGVSDPDDFIS